MSKNANSEIVVGVENDTVGEPQSKVAKKSSNGMIRFWSQTSHYQVAVTGEHNAQFVDHALLLKTDEPDAIAIRELNSPNIREIVDRPFEGEVNKAKFNKYLRGLIYTGEYGQPSKRGLIAVQSMFSRDECDDLVGGGAFQPDLLIVRALENKSFKEGI